MIRLLIATALLILGTAHARAASYFAVVGQVEANVCAFDEGAAPVSGSCSISGSGTTVNLSARADLGSLGASGSTKTVGINPLGQTAGGRGIVTAQLSDTIYFSGISDGTLILPVDIFGTLSVEGMVNYNRIGIFVGGQTVFARSLIGSGQTEFGSSIGTLGTSLFNLDFTGGFLNLDASMGIDQTCTAVNFGDVCGNSLDFYSSMRFLGASVFDTNGILAGGVTMQSDSGFDYAVGLQPHSITPVPLPPTILLVVCGYLLLLFQFRGRRQEFQA